MSLVDLNLRIESATLPGDVRAFLREAERRIDRFRGLVPGFVPSDFARSYAVLRALSEANLTAGNLFCEWGSGFGVVACLAALLDFDACGIEIEGTLVDAAQRLADDFGLPVEFIRGSFIPRNAEGFLDTADGFAWLTTEGGGTDEELGLAPDDFDVIFAYPWPDEEAVTEKLFERFAAQGAVLVTYHGGEEFRLRRKKRNKASRVKT